MSNNIGKLLQSDDFSDFQIICQGTVFPVHRNILACSSSVFQPMFGSDTLENQTGKMIIEDLEADIVEEMINYVYTGKVKDLVLEAKAMDLFVAADRFVAMSTIVVVVLTCSKSYVCDILYLYPGTTCQL